MDLSNTKDQDRVETKKELFVVLLHDPSVLCLGSLLPHSPPLLFLSLLYVILHTHCPHISIFFLLYGQPVHSHKVPIKA